MRVLFAVKQIDYEPQGILHLSSALKAAGHDVALTVASMEDPVRFAQEYRPHVLGYSVTTGSQGYYLDLNQRLRAKVDAFSVFGGPHPTYFPEMIGAQGVDGICLGEGEEALVDLVNALASGGDLTGIPNWWIKSADGTIHRNPVRPPTPDLDTLPPPDRKLIFDKDPFTRKSRLKHFITGRGCPYNCAYCYNQAYQELYRGKGSVVRRRSVDAVLAELQWVRDGYPLEFVVFLDDTFIWPRDWLDEFCARYPNEVGLPFFCNVRPNLVDQEVVRLLKDAGCVSVGMGLESGDDRLRNQVLKRNLTREKILEASRLLHEADISIITTNMLGLPASTLESDWATLDLNVACRPGYANSFLYQPYPRTALGDFTRDRGLMAGSLDDIASSAWDSTILNFDADTKRQLENLNHLFALAVEWPWALPVIKRLIKLPRNPVYRLAYKLFKGYAVKKRIHPYHPSLAEFVETGRRFMRFD